MSSALDKLALAKSEAQSKRLESQVEQLTAENAALSAVLDEARREMSEEFERLRKERDEAVACSQLPLPPAPVVSEPGELEEVKKELEELKLKHESAVEKFYKLKEEFMKQKARASEAEARAMEAERLAGKGSFNEDTTRILHLRENPWHDALKAKYARELEEERERWEAGGASRVDVETPRRGASNIDYKKQNLVLKENFNALSATFRNAVREM